MCSVLIVSRGLAEGLTWLLRSNDGVVSKSSVAKYSGLSLFCENMQTGERLPTAELII